MPQAGYKDFNELLKKTKHCHIINEWKELFDSLCTVCKVSKHLYDNISLDNLLTTGSPDTIANDHDSDNESYVVANSTSTSLTTPCDGGQCTSISIQISEATSSSNQGMCMYVYMCLYVCVYICTYV